MVNKLPDIIVSTVWRVVEPGDIHGNLYYIHTEEGIVRQLFEYSKKEIDWGGRGSGRGLRGIAISQEHIFVAASEEILVFDLAFNYQNTIKNKYFGSIHEIFIDNNLLYISSTSFDSIIIYDLVKMSFINGFQVHLENAKLVRWKRRFNRLIYQMMGKRPLKLNEKFSISYFDPGSDSGPDKKNILHLNNVFARKNNIYISGLMMNQVLEIDGNRIDVFARIPFGTHNVQFFKDGLLFNDSRSDRLVYFNLLNRQKEIYQIPKFEESNLLHADLPEEEARQGFGRGLKTNSNGYIFSGSSPATVNIFRQGESIPIKTINISMDVRCTVHGLAVYD